jgi:hypothetical protein
MALRDDIARSRNPRPDIYERALELGATPEQALENARQAAAFDRRIEAERRAIRAEEHANLWGVV